VKVAVLKGGRSLERGVSLRSGARVEDALGRLGHEVLPIDVGADLVKCLVAEQPDVAFVAMHGVGGEDGTVQELLEILGVPFTGPGAAACARCMDKVQAKDAIELAGRETPGLKTPHWFAFNQTAFREFGAGDALGRLEETLGFPLVVKPSRGGSSLGVKFARSPGEVPQALVSAFSYDDRVLLERFVDGRELAVSILGDEPLPVVEAIPLKGDRYDFEARYEIGRTRFACPAELSAEEKRAVTETALRTYRALGCTGFARVDLILGEDGPWLLEANAIPGLTDTSLLPQAAEAAGLNFEQLVERILDLALTPQGVS
jgi:D-alanine-D-alanine ligase